MSRRGEKGLVPRAFRVCCVLVFLGVLPGTAVAVPPALVASVVPPATATADSSAQALPAELAEPDASDSLLPSVWRPSGTKAVLATPFFPGWGQLYTNNGWRAVLAFGAQTFYWSHVLMNDRKAERYQAYARSLPESAERDLYGLQVEEYRERVRDFTWWSLGALLIIALDAYVDTHLFDFGRDTVPVPDRWEDDGSRRSAARTDASAASPLGVVIWQCRLSY